MATRIRTLNFLPEIFQTPTNAQFLGATLDLLVDQPNTKKNEGYIGSKFGYGINAKDYYVTEPTKVRTDYQLDPGVVFTKPNENVAQDFISYPGIVDGFKVEGGLTTDNSELFESEFYSWDSFTDLDKLINFNEYYWLPEGPESVVVATETVFSENDYNVIDLPNGYGISPVGSTTTTTNPTLTLLRGGIYTFNVNLEDSNFWIQGAPGVTGFSPTQPNLQTRDVYGVTNNGAQTGAVIFEVPLKNAQDQYNLPGNNLVDVVSTLPFSQVNGQPVNTFTGIDGVTSLNGLRVLFYNTGIPNEIGYISSYFGEVPYDVDNPLFNTPQTITISQTLGSNVLRLGSGSTSTLAVNQTISFTGTIFGGVVNTQVYYIKQIVNSTDFSISLTPGGSVVSLSPAAGTMTGIIDQGFYEEGDYTTVNDNFYRVQYVGDPANPVIRLVPDGGIPTSQKITATYGTQYISRSFFKNVLGAIELIPYLSATLDTLYYQDSQSSNKVGIIKLVDSNATNTLDVETDILGKKNFTATNGVVFTNGLKVTFQGDIYPASYKTGEYYVEGVGTAIELIPVEELIVPEPFTQSTFIPWDTVGWDSANWEGNSYIPVLQDYITIARNSINKNPWSRSNRWFHIDVINATATYNNNSNLVSIYATPDNKAKRPIIEFYPNLKLFNSGSYGKNPVDFIDFRTTDAFSLVAGQQNYYPDVQGYTAYTASIASTNYATARTFTATSATNNQVTVNSTTGFRVNDLVKISTLAGIGNLNYNESYYVVEVVDGTHITVSEEPNGDVKTLTTASGTADVTWTPLSTIITVPAADVSGTFGEALYVADSTNVIPRNSQIVSITGSTTLTITISWPEASSDLFDAQTNSSIISTPTTVDNFSLFEGSRVIFAADTNANVRNKIYISRFSTVTGSSTPVITLTEAVDGQILAGAQTAIYRGYNYQGKDFWYNNVDWVYGQQKTTVNQAPLFDVYDRNSISFGDSSVYVGTSFTGNKLFSYGIGSGPDDLILGFPVRYSSIDNVGDISFDVSLNQDSFTYVSGTNPETKKVNTGYVHNYISEFEYVRELGWKTAVSPSVQYQLFSFDFDPLIQDPTFICDISANLVTNWPTIQVYINNDLQPTSAYTAAVGDTTTLISLNSSPTTETVIQVAILSDQVSETAFYSIPINLNNNPLNADLTTVNVGDIRGQYQSIFYNNPNTTGEVFGANNYRDIGNVVSWGTKIIQNSASLVLPGTFLRKQNHDLFDALRFNNKEYIKFKTLLMDTVDKTAYMQTFNPSEMLDTALDVITSTKTQEQAFFWSDMLPSKAAYITNTYTFANSLDTSIYPLSRVYDFTQANYYGVLVYLTRTVEGVTGTTQLIKNQDYTVSTTEPALTITLDLAPGDKITIKEYNQTYGSYCPNTPTKLGLYPAFVPQVILDNNYFTPTYFILGHDGSYTRLYGDYDPTNGLLIDFKDQVLLEYEKRIYNNLKLSNVIPIQEYEVLPGFFRNTSLTLDQFLEIYRVTFLDWIGTNRVDYKTQVYNKNNYFSYNYFQSANKLNQESITPGYWRGVYQYFYDTTTPDSTPWEMLGYKNQPSWWTSRYGPAPYTSDNLVLWGDLAEGIDWNDGTPVIIPQAIRPGLLDIIPVDSAGNLLSPLECIVGNYTPTTMQRDWKVGDMGPTELSYRRSSSWPFDLMRIMALSKPAKFYNLAVDLDNYKYNLEFNQYLVNDRSHLVISDIEIYGNGTAKTSYINWIVDYEKQVGVDATANITTLLDNLDVRLIYRLAGFSDKTLLKFYVEKGTPNSRNASLLIPDESYSVLLYDNQPFEKVQYSSIIVQIVPNGYSVYGNSQTSAYFRTLAPANNGNYNNVTIGNITVKVPKDYTDQVVLVPYGTVFYTPQEVALFINGYGEYLKQTGMVFDEIENGLEINWEQMTAEFVYWSQTGWENGSIATLNPAANKLKINKDSYVVQPLTMQQTNFVLNENLYPIQAMDMSVYRNETEFSVRTLNQGDSIGYGQFNISNFEHGIVFDNVTLFDDVIYNLATGLRQNRIYTRGTKTADWNGTVTTSGFILNQDNIREWNKQTKYTKGQIVKYKNKYWTATKIIQAKEVFDEKDWKRTDYDQIQKGLLPNASTRAYESTLYYDIDKANLENDADLLSFSLIGYRPRDYLALADLTDITQVNVYKNMIKNKGTKNAADAFKGANLPQGGIDYEIYENWAIKSGEFGGVLNGNFIEFKLNQNYLTGNPSVVGLNDGDCVDGVQQEVPLYSLFNFDRPVNDVNVLPTITAIEPSTVFPDAGYVNFDDVKMSSFYYSSLPTAVNKNGVIVPIQELYVRDYVWLANYLEKWNVFTPVASGQVVNVKNNLNGTATITFGQAHNLNQYEPFAVVNFSPIIDNYYIALVIVDPYSVIVSLTLEPSTLNLTGNGVGLQFQSQRVDQPSDINNLPLLDSEFIKNKVWVDNNNDGNWAVYRKGINYQYESALTKTSSLTFGSAVAYTDILGYLIGDQAKGEVYRYTFNDLFDTYQLSQTITPLFTVGDFEIGQTYEIVSLGTTTNTQWNTIAGTVAVTYSVGNSFTCANIGTGLGDGTAKLDDATSFGSAITYGSDLFAISQPTSSNEPCVLIYQLFNTTINANLDYQQMILARDSSTDWGSAMAMSGDQNWLYISATDLNRVYVYRKSQLTGQYEYSTYFTVAGLSAGDKFGYSIATDYYGDTIVVGAPFKNYLSAYENWGYSYVFNRAAQNIEVQYTTSAGSYQSLQLAWTPTTLSVQCTQTVGATDRITCADTTGFTVDDPVIFSGSIYSGSNILPGTVYYIESIVSGTQFRIKTSRTAVSPVDLGSSGPSTGMYVNVQTQPLFVSVNGTLVTDNNYGVVGSTLQYSGTLNAGDIVNVSGQEIILAQTLTTEQTPRIGVQFGHSVDTTTHGSEILVGAPFNLNSENQEGAVYRFTNGGGNYGIIIGTNDVNVTTTRKILLNGYLVNIPAGNATVAANAINIAKITNVTASASNGKLIISLIDNDLSTPNEKLLLVALNSSTYSELGITTYTQTQIINCPHVVGPTQFGYTVKFNEFDSFIASAPAGIRYSGTTFDFSDDELDNDTVFDNNATQFVDTAINAGAVYMFDYLENSNESLSNIGQYVYAQSVNARDQNYGAQPYYGTALDFNNNNVIVGSPNFNVNTVYGQVVTYNNVLGLQDWSVYRSSSPVVDINRINNAQIFSAETNNTLINLDYIDPLQGKILGAARQNIDVVSNIDPARYNNGNNVETTLSWGAGHLGQIWLDTSRMCYVNYHQDSVTYNSKYWGTLFPNSDPAVYTWVASNVLPSSYQGPGTPYDINSYSIQFTVSPTGALVPTYYFWARNTNIVFTNAGKTLADSIVEAYIRSPVGSGISYFAPLLPSTFGLYNTQSYVNANDSVFHIGYSTGTNNDVAHNQYSLIRSNFADDFLPGLPSVVSRPITTIYGNINPTGGGTPEGLYDRLLDSMAGVDESGQVVPNPFLPKAVQYGVLVRPRQSFFVNRFGALKNYLTYANEVLSQFPITETREYSFLFRTGEINPSTVDNPQWTTGPELFYDTRNYWEYVNWWATGYDNNTKSSIQVPIYADLSTLDVPAGTIVTVEQNGNGKAETYIYSDAGTWDRIGLQNGTIKFKSVLWDYTTARLGFGDNFFDTTPYDDFPSQETRFILRALNEEIYTDELTIYRNKSLILLFEYIQSETIESQNYLPWLNKTSFIDVSHKIRELRPIEVFQSDNQDFLSGYLNEIKPYHVVIKEFLFKYTGEDVFEGDITDFDLPAEYNSSIQQFVTPQLVYASPNGDNQFLPDAAIWQNPNYSQWYNNYGISLIGEKDYPLTVLSSYIALNTDVFVVDNASGLPVNGVLKIGEGNTYEEIGYSSVDYNLNVVSGLTRGVNGTAITTHIPGEFVLMDLPPVLLLDSGRGYTNPPKVTAYIDTTIYPAPTVPAELQAVMNLDSVLRIDVINPGQGYAIQPEIRIDSAFGVTFASTEVNTSTNTIRLYAPTLQTGDLIQYKIGANTTAIGGLETNQWYYVNVLETSPLVVVALYTNYGDAIKDTNRVDFYTTGTGDNHSLNVGAKASCITASTPVRENITTLRFDRTTYNSQVLDWEAGAFYGAYYAGQYNNTETGASSSIQLESTQPPINSILASNQGVAFEITDVTNDRVITFSSLARIVARTYSGTNIIRMTLLDDGSGNPNASGSTIGFYEGMPIKFVGATGSSNLVNGTTYYVKEVVNETDFKVSSSPSGSVYALGNQIITAAGLKAYTGSVTDTGILTVTYPGITSVTATQANTNKLTIPLNATGSGGTNGFYVGLPLFFTGNVFGGVIENDNYYVTTVCDKETFTISKNPNPFTLTMLETDSATDTILVDGVTDGLNLNDPIIFNTFVFDADQLVSGQEYVIASVGTTDFTALGAAFNTVGTRFTASASFTGTGTGTVVSNYWTNIEAGKVYYVSSFVGATEFKIAEGINLAPLALTDSVVGTGLITSQTDTYNLTTATGDMTININLPVSPGQVNGQLFTLYETSGQYINQDGIIDAGDFVIGRSYTIQSVGTTDFTLIGASSNTIGVIFTATGIGSGTGTAQLTGERVQRLVGATVQNSENIVAITEDSGGLTNFYINMPVQLDTAIGLLSPSTTYYIKDMGTIEIEISTTSSSGNLLTCDTTDQLYIDMPILFSGTGLGGIDIDVEYYIHTIVNGTQFTITNTPGGSVVTLQTSNGTMYGTGQPYVQLSSTVGGSVIDPGSSQQTCTISVGTPAVITVAVAPANGTKVVFRTDGTLPTGIVYDFPYYVVNSSGTTFNVALLPGGTAVDTTAAGSGTFTVIDKNEIYLNQTPLTTAVFDVSYVLGGYRVVITNPGSGYAVDNTIIIPGTEFGGTSPINDLTLTVNTVNQISIDPITGVLTSDGEITSVICSGTVPGASANYYLKVISPNEFAVFANSLLTIPVSGLTLPYNGTISTTATATTSPNTITVGSTVGFAVNDPVVFTGTVFGGIILGVKYYITSLSPLQVSATPGGTAITLSTATGTMLMTKQGDYALLPEPFYFNQSIVKYNDQAWQCIVSNNDNEFILGKWKLLDSGSRLLNALDRIRVYYQPTDNMPGVNLSQLVNGITYPNSTYLGNEFNPDEQFEIDTIIPSSLFYPTALDFTSVTSDGRFLASMNATSYSGVALTGIISPGYGTYPYSTVPYDDESVVEERFNWEIDRVTNSPISTTDIIYAGGYYIMTSSNPATPILRSNDGVVWTTNGYFTPYSASPWDDLPFDQTSLSVASLLLNSVAYNNNKFVAVGQNIVTSIDTYGWNQTYQFSNSALTNILYGVSGVTVTGFNGFIAVGKGQEYDYSTGVTQIVDINLILKSTDGITWNTLPTYSYNGFRSVVSGNNKIIAVGENGVIYMSTDGGTSFAGVTETQVLSTTSVGDVMNLLNTTYLSVGQKVRFYGESFGGITTGTDYWLKTVTAGGVTLSSDSGLVSTVTLTDAVPSTRVNISKYPGITLNDVTYSTYSSIFVAVGDDGRIITSPDGVTWTTRTSGTIEKLNGVGFNASNGYLIAVGNNNTILLSSNNGVTWTSDDAFTNEPSIYDIQGDAFTAGYGPEELVPGVVTDNLIMTVATRPGTNWPATEYAHVGYGVTSVELTPTNSTQTVYSFANVAQTPAQIMVAVIDVNGLSTTIYATIDYTIDWVNFTIELSTPISPTEKLRIDVYETGNGDQLVKANTKTDPIRHNDETGWKEIYVNCNYSATIFAGNGIIQPGTSPVSAQVFETEAGSNTITCDEVKNFTLNDPITFQGATFGGLLEDTTYYVKTISYVTNTITVSLSYNAGTGTAGPTVPLTTATGFCYAIINPGSGQPWTDPLVYHNGTKLVHGVTETVTRTNAARDTVTCHTTGGLIVGTPIVFSDTMFGDILPQTTYYIHSIYDGNEFRISETQGGPIYELTDATGGAEFITNDYAFGIQPNGIQATLIFAQDYNADDDYIQYTLFGQTAPAQYGYTIPEVQLFTGTGVETVFNLTNYISPESVTSGIVEVDGLRLKNADYTIDANAETITFATAPALNSVIAVTTYNLTDRQYFKTQYGITASPGSTTVTFVIGSTTNINYAYDALVDSTQLIAGQEYTIVSVGTTDFTLLGAASNTVGLSFTATGYGSGTGTATIAYDESNYGLENLSYLTMSSGTTGDLNINDKVTFSAPTIGGIIADTPYYVTSIINSTDFTVSLTLGGEDYEVYNDTGSMSSAANALNVAPIASITNAITPYLAQTNVSATTTGTNEITCSSTANFVVDQTVQFKIPSSGTAFGGISTSGTVYYIDSVVNSTTFTIKDENGNQINLTTDTGTMVAFVGGNPSVRVTTSIPHKLITNSLIRIDGTSGSVQLNNKVFYVHVINSTEIDLYEYNPNDPAVDYDPALYAVNYPITVVSSYTGGGYVWLDGLFVLSTTIASATSSSNNTITVLSTSDLVIDTPVYFTEGQKQVGETTLGGLIVGKKYYVKNFATSTSFRISETRGGDELTLTTTTGSMNVTQWEQTDVDRLWVTVNGYRVPSSSLRLNPANFISILTEIVPGDIVTITSMMPSATPNEEVYLLNVNRNNDPSVYQANAGTRTWILSDLFNTSESITVEDVQKITNTIVQNASTPVAVNGYHYIGLNADKNLITSITVYNNTTGSTILPSNYVIEIEGLVPTLKITSGAYITASDTLTITILEGNRIYMNGEVIGFTTVNTATNTLEGLQRGLNGTGIQTFIPKYSEVYGLLSTNLLGTAGYTETWNPIPGIYNETLGDPLQIAETNSAIFLNQGN